MSGKLYISLIAIITLFKVVMGYIFPLFFQFSFIDKILLSVTGVSMLIVTYFRSRRLKYGKYLFYLILILMIPSEIIYATDPYGQEVNIYDSLLILSSILNLIIIAFLTFLNAEKSTGDLKDY